MINKSISLSLEEMTIDLEQKTHQWSSMSSITYEVTSKINQVIIEELNPFFEGKKSARDAVGTLLNTRYMMLNE